MGLHSQHATDREPAGGLPGKCSFPGQALEGPSHTEPCGACVWQGPPACSQGAGQRGLAVEGDLVRPRDSARKGDRVSPPYPYPLPLSHVTVIASAVPSDFPPTRQGLRVGPRPGPALRTAWWLWPGAGWEEADLGGGPSSDFLPESRRGNRSRWGGGAEEMGTLPVPYTPTLHHPRAP